MNVTHQADSKTLVIIEKMVIPSEERHTSGTTYVQDTDVEGDATEVENQLQPLNEVRIELVEDARPAGLVPLVDRIGKWEFDTIMGEGAFGVVYAAHNVEIPAHAAVKRIGRPTIQPHPKRGVRWARAQVKVRSDAIARESVLLKVLNHPRIVGLHEVFETKDATYIVMELVDNGTLHDHIGKINIFETARLFSQIVDAVSYCHSLKICHRDLKPDNILLDERCNVKIADFGLGSMHADGIKLRERCGTAYYTAPEITLRYPYDGRVCDIWSLGVILYAMITGDLPFTGATREVEEKSVEGQFSVPSFVPEDARDLIERMLSVNPEERITMWEVVHHPFFERTTNRPRDPIPTLEDLAFGPIANSRDLDENAFKSILLLCQGASPESLAQALLSPCPNVEQLVYHRILDFDRSHPSQGHSGTDSRPFVAVDNAVNVHPADVFGAVQPIMPKPKPRPRSQVPPRPKPPTYLDFLILPPAEVKVKVEVVESAEISGVTEIVAVFEESKMAEEIPVHTPVSVSPTTSLSETGTPALVRIAQVAVVCTKEATTDEPSKPPSPLADAVSPSPASSVLALAHFPLQSPLSIREVLAGAVRAEAALKAEDGDVMDPEIKEAETEVVETEVVAKDVFDESTATMPKKEPQDEAQVIYKDNEHSKSRESLVSIYSTSSAPSSIRSSAPTSSYAKTGSMPSLGHPTPATSIHSPSSIHGPMTPSPLPPFSFLCPPSISEVLMAPPVIKEEPIRELEADEGKPDVEPTPNRLRFSRALRSVPSLRTKGTLSHRLSMIFDTRKSSLADEPTCPFSPTSTPEEPNPYLSPDPPLHASKSMGDLLSSRRRHSRMSPSPVSPPASQLSYDAYHHVPWLKRFGTKHETPAKDVPETPNDKACRSGVLDKLLRRSIKAVRTKKRQAQV